ncbi:hypothetical protein VME0621_01255 [Vibrio mediterranei]|uniref:hypothetical protein n=1 Tax=Vibrio mediterranei TaxID=689 RepID=UPI000783E0F8|nr:hypothetical protein [Vibrio mediterranei]SBO09162.1 hypothetical protein VME0621_01255 [Vibrio mediterranei]
MKVRSVIVLSVLLGSGSVVADSDLDIVNKDMGGLEQVSGDEKLYIATGDGDFVHDAALVDALSLTDSDVYLTSEEAKRKGLTATKTFYVYAFLNIKQLDEKLVKHIKTDNPEYFSVDLYKNYVGDEDVEQFVAKVIEYQ